MDSALSSTFTCLITENQCKDAVDVRFVRVAWFRSGDVKHLNDDFNQCIKKFDVIT